MTKNLNRVGRDLFASIQELTRPDFSVEVGAFDASFSRFMRRKLPDQQVYAFEAVPENYNNFKRKNSKINYLNLAVSNQVGTTQLLVQVNAPRIAENNSLLAQTNPDVKYKKVDVPSTTLDSFFIESGLIRQDQSACLWLDVEGAANLVLQGSSRFLNQVSSIYIEVELVEMWTDQWLDSHVISYLENLGFILVMRDLEAYPHQENLIFVQKSSVPLLQEKELLLSERLRLIFYRMLETALRLRDFLRNRV